MRDILSKLDSILSEDTPQQPNHQDLNNFEQAVPEQEPSLFQIGDGFGISLSEEFEIGSEIIDILEDGIVVELDEHAMLYLQEQGFTFEDIDLEENKIKGVDNKACWKGYRYAGTENHKDKCVKVGEGWGAETQRKELEQSNIAIAKVLLKYRDDPKLSQIANLMFQNNHNANSIDQTLQGRGKYSIDWWSKQVEKDGPSKDWTDMMVNKYLNNGVKEISDQDDTFMGTVKNKISGVEFDVHAASPAGRDGDRVSSLIYLRDKDSGKNVHKFQSTAEINKHYDWVRFPGKFGEDSDDLSEAEYQGRNVPLNKPMKGDVKKSKVYVKGPKGNVVKVNFGDKKMKIKKSNPARRKSFRARHKCHTAKDRTTARYWSCRSW